MKLKKIGVNTVLLFLCLLFLGMILSLQYKTAKQNNDIQETSTATEIKELKEKLNDEIEKGKVLLEENQKLQMNYQSYVDSYIEEFGDYELDNKISELNKLKMFAGLTDIEGEGIIITMKDAVKTEGTDVNMFLIHDMDLVRVINELKIAGAYAISINEERLLNISEIMCAGPTVRINRNRYPVPFVIKAVSNDKDVLAKNLEDSIIIALLKEYDITIEIVKTDKVFIGRYAESINWAISDIEVVDNENN